MPATYSATGSNIRPYRLTYHQLAAIGRMMRACAEIEDIATLYLYRLADLVEGTGMLLVGRIAITNKVRLIGQFAKARGPDHVRLYKQAFDNEHFRDLLKCRNTVAHGYLLGLTDSNEIAFQVQETQGFEGQKLYTTINAYGHDDFKNLARMAEGIIPQMEEALGLKALREKRQQPTLTAHIKSQPTRK